MPQISYYPALANRRSPLGEGLSTFSRFLPAAGRAADEMQSESRRDMAIEEARKYLMEGGPMPSAQVAQGAANTGAATAGSVARAIPGPMGAIAGAAVGAAGAMAPMEKARVANDVLERLRVRTQLEKDAPGFVEAFDEEVAAKERDAYLARMLPKLDRRIVDLTKQLGPTGQPLLDKDMGATIKASVVEGRMTFEEAMATLTQAKVKADQETHDEMLSSAKGILWMELHKNGQFNDMIDRASTRVDELGNTTMDRTKGSEIVYQSLDRIMDQMSLEQQVAFLTVLNGSPAGAMVGSMLINSALGAASRVEAPAPSNAVPDPISHVRRLMEQNADPQLVEETMREYGITFDDLRGPGPDLPAKKKSEQEQIADMTRTALRGGALGATGEPPKTEPGIITFLRNLPAGVMNKEADLAASIVASSSKTKRIEIINVLTRGFSVEHQAINQDLAKVLPSYEAARKQLGTRKIGDYLRENYEEAGEVALKILESNGEPMPKQGALSTVYTNAFDAIAEDPEYSTEFFAALAPYVEDQLKKALATSAKKGKRKGEYFKWLSEMTPDTYPAGEVETLGNPQPIPPR